MINDFNYVAPELEGIDSKDVIELLNFMDRMNINVYSFLLARNGNIVAEGYYKPMDEKFMHRLYSCSKTYVAIAIGLLYGEGKLKLEDKLIDYFPECVRDDMDEWTKNCTIEQTLTMTVPGETGYSRYPDWGTFFFHPDRPGVKPAGAMFAYSTVATVVLNRLVEKLAGKKLLDYMRPMLDKIGVSKDIWCVETPDGTSWGGSGVICTTRDFAKFGELLMNMGSYKGEQLIPLDYMQRATTAQISNKKSNACGNYSSSGYGYQIWKSPHGFWLAGMGGQAIFCYPEKNMIFAYNSDTQTPGGLDGKTIMGDLVDHFVYERIGEAKEPGEDYEKLKEKLASLKMKADFGTKTHERAKLINGKTYELYDNPCGWKNFRIDLDENEGSLTYENARGVKTIKFGLCEYKKGKFPETHYYDKKVKTPSNREFDMVACGAWNYNNLLIKVFITDTNKGNLFINIGFTDDLKETAASLVKVAEFFLDDYNGQVVGKLKED